MMSSTFLKVICDISIFLIIAQTFLQLRARSSYEKYIKLLISIMVLIKLLVPFRSFLFGEKLFDAEKLMTQIQSQWESSLLEATHTLQGEEKEASVSPTFSREPVQPVRIGGE